MKTIMKTKILIFVIAFTSSIYGQESTNQKEIYFNLDLRNLTKKQVFHIDTQNEKRQFAILGKIVNAYRPFFSRKYAIQKAQFEIENFGNDVYDVKIDSIVPHLDLAERIDINIYISEYNENSSKSNIPPPTNFKNKKMFKRSTINITIWDYVKDKDGEFKYKKLKVNKGFGDHICKSKVLF